MTVLNLVSRLSGSFNFNTDEIDAADVTLPAMCWSHGRRVRIKRPHSRHTLMLKHTALVIVDDVQQHWQAATVPGCLGGRTFWLPGIKVKLICYH